MHMGILMACMSVHHVQAVCIWYLWKPEEGIESLGTRVRDGWNSIVGVEIESMSWKSS